MSHIIAEPMREICWVHAGVYPASNAICDAKGDVGGVLYLGDEEGILAGVGTGAFVLSPGDDTVVGVEGEDVGVGVVAMVFGCEGGGYAVGVFWDGGSVRGGKECAGGCSNRRL